MVTLIRGTEKTDGSHALKSAALIAAVSYQIFNRRTLILQVGNTGIDLEYYMNGKTDTKSLFGGEVDLSEMGIDALLLRAEGARVTREHFESLTDDIINGPLHLDVAPRSKTKHIEENILANLAAMHELLKSAAGDSVANAPYDNVIVVMKDDNRELSRELRRMADYEIICVGQGEAEFEPEKESKSFFKKSAVKDKCQTIILVQDFEADSKYNTRFMKKAYNTGNVFTIPHNILLNDAFAGGRLVAFVNRNAKIDATDYNYALFNSVKSLMERIFKKAMKEEAYEEALEKRGKKDARREKYEIPEGSVEVGVVRNKRQESIQIAVNPNARGEVFKSVTWEEMPRQGGFEQEEQFVPKKKKSKKRRIEDMIFEEVPEDQEPEERMMFSAQAEPVSENFAVQDEAQEPVMMAYKAEEEVAEGFVTDEDIEIDEFDDEEMDIIEEVEDLPDFDDYDNGIMPEEVNIGRKEMDRQEAKLAKKKKKGGLFSRKEKKRADDRPKKKKPRRDRVEPVGFDMQDADRPKKKRRVPEYMQNNAPVIGYNDPSSAEPVYQPQVIWPQPVKNEVADGMTNPVRQDVPVEQKKVVPVKETDMWEDLL